jgi:hypothetical protein
VTSDLSTALRAAAAGLHPDEAGTDLAIRHGIYLGRDDFARYVRTASIGGGIPAWPGVTSASPAWRRPGRIRTSRRS